MNKVIGIDLGTTNSVVAVMEGGNSTVISSSEGSRTTPSIVAFNKKTKDLLVGQLAKRQAVINPENTFSSIKRFMGRKFSEIKNDTANITYNVTSSETGSIKIPCPIIEKDLTPEEISSHILRKLSSDASKFLKQPVNKAVITVPAYFNDSQRQATKDAGKIAGLEVLRIVNEPTAASLAYGLGKEMKNEIILVFDLGGGTFDVSLLEVGDGLFEVLSTSGDTYLGGNDFDKVIVDYLLEDFKTKEGVDLSLDKQALQRLTEAAEKAKIELSNLTESNINIPFIASVDNETKHIDVTLSRAKFEELSSSLVSRCKEPVLNAIKDAKIDKNRISEVVLVGGSTRIPAIQALVKEIVNKKPNQSVNPDEVVAVGAAVQGGVLVGEVENILLLDVTPLSLGVETYGGLMTTLIARNTTVPIEISEIFTTASDNQPFVEVHVLQGERELAEQNKSLGRFKLENIPLAPRGTPQIQVTFDIDVDGILSVKAKEITSGLEQSIRIEGASNLDDNEVKKIIKEAESFAAEDEEKKSIIEKLNEIEANVDKAEKFLKDSKYQGIITSSLQENLTSLFEEARSIMKKRDLNNDIRGLKDEVNNIYEKLKLSMEELMSTIQNVDSSNKDKDKTSNQDKIIEVDFDSEN